MTYKITDEVTGSIWEATNESLSDMLHGILDSAEQHWPGTIANVDALLERMHRGDHYRYLENYLGVRVEKVEV